nr:hypothetical protein [Tanacetum cinerariifolium]
MFFFYMDEFIFFPKETNLESVTDSLSEYTQFTFEQRIMFNKLFYLDDNEGRIYRCSFVRKFKGEIIYKTEGKIMYYHYHVTISERQDPCRCNAPGYLRVKRNVLQQDNGSFIDKIIFDLNRAPDSPNQFHCFHCKDVLRDGEACKRCTCVKCGSGLGKGLCYICGHNQNSLNDSPSISETSSQSPPNINHCCYDCGDPLDGIICKRCTCKSCGKDAHIGYNCPSKVPVISNPKPCNNQTIDELPQTLQISHPTFQYEAESPFTLDSTPTYVDESPNVFNLPPQSFVSDSLNDNIISGLPPFSAITPDEPIFSTEEPDNSLSMGDEHLDTIPAMELDEFIKSSVANLILIPSESEEVMEIVIPEVGGIDDDILLTIKDDILRGKLLSVNLLISKIESLNANPTPSSDCKTKSSSISLNSLLEETNTFDNSLLEFETFCFDVDEISSGSTTTPPDISLPEYEVFYDDHVKEINSSNPTTHFDSSLYASFIFDLSINPFYPADRSDSYEFTNELIPFISAPEYDCFLFKVEPNSWDFTKDVVEDISPTKEP